MSSEVVSSPYSGRKILLLSILLVLLILGSFYLASFLAKRDAELDTEYVDKVKVISKNASDLFILMVTRSGGKEEDCQFFDPVEWTTCPYPPPIGANFGDFLNFTFRVRVTPELNLTQFDHFCYYYRWTELKHDLFIECTATVEVS